MTHRIFLSHKNEDKPVVEPVALRLRDIFGQASVFYDAWSIQPGDGIVDMMNQGLQAPEFVFFFVSKLSVESGLVKVEWQNALMKASKGETRLVPVRIDHVAMPEVLRQSLYIDMYSVGLEVALNQIVNVVQRNSTFTPQHLGFTNLSFSATTEPDKSITVVVSASHLMEPNPNLILMLKNVEGEIKFELNGGGPMLQGFYAKPFNEIDANGFTLAPMGGAITPERPMRIRLTPAKVGVELQLVG